MATGQARLERFSNTFENLLAALADAVKQLGEGSQQPWARTRVEEAKQEFVTCCDIMCLQLKQAIEVIRQELLLQALPSSAAAQGAVIDADQVRQVLEAAEHFAAQLRSGGGSNDSAADELTGSGGAAAAPHYPAVKEETAPAGMSVDYPNTVM